MKAIYWGSVLWSVAIWLAAAQPLNAQPAEADRKTFDEVKAKADAGDPESQLVLAGLYASGAGVRRDAAKAARWHRKAAEQGLARAQHQLGLDYLHGEGVKPDRVQAVAWLSKAAEQGLPQAQLDLGLCYLHGRGVSENGVEALKWFREAAAQGLVDAQFEVGNCYLEGRGVAKDIEEATRWIRLAAERGFPLAQNTLGLHYVKGTGVSRDLVQAYKWLSLAAASDDEHAPEIRVNIAKVEASLTKEQVAQAQRLAREFRPATGTTADGGTLPSANAEPSSQPPGPGQFDTNAAKPLPAESLPAGFLTVKADDESCEVYADGSFVGHPPARLKLAQGMHLIEVKKDGFKAYRREIKVAEGSDLQLRVALEKQ
jgi:TPR repeat protein